MNIKGQSSTSSEVPGCEATASSAQQESIKRLDTNIFQRQRVLTGNDEQAEKRRARESEYWRQRTLERQKQMQQRSPAECSSCATDSCELALERMDVRHRTGKLLNYFMDAYNELKPPQPFFNWIESLTHLDQIRILQQVVEDRGYRFVIKPEWVRAFKRGCRCLYASCDSFVESFVQGEHSRSGLAAG